MLTSFCVHTQAAASGTASSEGRRIATYPTDVQDRYTSRPQIRPCDRKEIGDLLVLWREAEARASTTDDVASLRALLEHDPGSLLVAELDDRIVGSVIAAWDGWRGNMYRLAVHPRYRRRGIGLLLVEASEAKLRTLGCRRITALVVGDDSEAAAVWLRAGYLYDERMARYVKQLESSAQAPTQRH
jgi:ribosomal protein S18 acetylase RimI-like enzyme